MDSKVIRREGGAEKWNKNIIDFYRMFSPVGVLVLSVVCLMSTPSAASTSVATGRGPGPGPGPAGDGFQPSPILSYTIEEETSRGTVVIADLRRDAGLSSWYASRNLSALTFVFPDRKPPNAAALFILANTSGQMTTAGLVDRDTLCPSAIVRGSCVLSLQIAVQPAAFFQIINVEVTVTDINDNAPAFPMNLIRKTVPENIGWPRELFPVPSATDLDAGENGVVEYRLVTEGDDVGTFSLKVSNSSGGIVVDLSLLLAERLDRESKDRYTIQVVAYDGGKPRRSGALAIEIEVTDVNDNSPTFTSASYNWTVREDRAVGSTIGVVTATDPDQGRNGQVTYQISQRSQIIYPGTFSINSETGQLTLVSPLDREKQNAYTLVVSASDSGENAVTSLTTVRLTVLDVNDNRPEILIDYVSDRKRLEVKENASPGTFVAYMSVKDKDEGESGRVECALTGSDLTLARIYEKEFKIVTGRAFDRETEQSVTSLLTCRDFGRPTALTSTLDLSVWIADVDDHRPQFSRDVYYASLLENNEPEVAVLNVSVVDADSSSQHSHQFFFYSLDERAAGKFLVGRTSGVIVAAISFDREEETEDCVEFGVRATTADDESFSAAALVRVRIVDVDDEVPKFSSSVYRFEASEDAEVGTYVGTIVAVDRDLWPHNESWYELDRETNYGDFEIDPISGRIVTSGRLDREIRESYILKGIVYSRGSPTTRADSVSVFVKVRDCNDNRPVIIYPSPANDTVVVSWSSPVGATVATVAAYDNDVGNNALLRYGLARESDYVTVVHDTGKVLLKRVLPENATFVLEVVVSDGGVPPLNATAFLHVFAATTDDKRFLSSSSSSFSFSTQLASKNATTGSQVFVLAGALVGCVVISVSCVVAMMMSWKKLVGSRRKGRKKKGVMWPVAPSSRNELAASAADDYGEDHAGQRQRGDLFGRDATRQTVFSTSISDPAILRLDSEPVNFATRHCWNGVGEGASFDRDGDSGLDLMITSITSHGSSADDNETMTSSSAAGGRRQRKSILTGTTNPVYLTGDGRYNQGEDFPLPPPPASLLFPADRGGRYQVVTTDDGTTAFPMTTTSTAMRLPWQLQQQQQQQQQQLRRSRSINEYNNSLLYSTLPRCAAAYASCAPFSQAGCGGRTLPVGMHADVGILFGKRSPPGQGQGLGLGLGQLPRSASYGSRKSVRFADEDDEKEL